MSHANNKVESLYDELSEQAKAVLTKTKEEMER